jgi:hypothetical protein
MDLRAVVWPTSGTGADLAGALEAAGDAGANACNGTPDEIVEKYLRWGPEQVRMLQGRIPSADLSRLVTAPRYWATVANPSPTPPTVNAIVDELVHQSRALKEAADAGRRAADMWRLADGHYSSLVLVDSNFWIEHGDSFGAIDWHALITEGVGPGHAAPGEELRLVVPILAIDELDAMTHKSNVRPKASGAARWLYSQLSGSTDRPATILPETSGRGKVTIQLVFDPPGHTRQPINDDELIERTIAFRNFLGVPDRQTFMLTYDAGAAFRAESNGLMPRLIRR